LRIKPFSMGSFSESCRVFEPALLKTVVEQLAGELHPVGRQAMFKDVPGVIELVDGTLLRTLRSVVGALVAAGHQWQGLPSHPCLETASELRRGPPRAGLLGTDRCPRQRDQRREAGDAQTPFGGP